MFESGQTSCDAEELSIVTQDQSHPRIPGGNALKVQANTSKWQTHYNVLTIRDRKLRNFWQLFIRSLLRDPTLLPEDLLPLEVQLVAKVCLGRSGWSLSSAVLPRVWTPPALFEAIDKSWRNSRYTWSWLTWCECLWECVCMGVNVRLGMIMSATVFLFIICMSGWCVEFSKWINKNSTAYTGIIPVDMVCFFFFFAHKHFHYLVGLVIKP